MPNLRSFAALLVFAISATLACSDSDGENRNPDAGGPPCTARFGGTDAGAAATITVDPATVVSTFIPKTMFGINAGSWVSKRDMQATQPKVQGAGNYFVRYPGGSRSDDYHWNGTGAYDDRHHWVPSSTSYTPGFTASELYRGTTSAGYSAPSLIADGNPDTMWLSNADTSFPNAQWAYVDLGAAKSVDSVQIVWGTPYATAFEVQTWSASGSWPLPYQASGDGKWTTTSAGSQVGTGGTQTVSFSTVSTQYVRILLSASSAGAAGPYAIAELTVWSGTTQLTSNVASVSQTPVTVSSTDTASEGSLQDVFDFESFMAYLQSFSPAADAMITVNFGTGTPEEAAAWVHYANRVKGYGIRYWQVGNELEGNWETGGPLNAADYVKRFVAFYDAMKAEDPTIVVLGPVSGGIGEFSNLGDNKTFIADFIALLAAVGKADHIDGIDFHWYPNWEAVSDTNGLATISQLGALAANLKTWLAAANAKPDIPVFMTEFNMGIGAANPPVYNNQLVAGLFTASALGEYVRNFGNGGTFLWAMLAGGPTNDWTTATAGDLGYLQTSNNAYIYQEHAQYWAMQLMSSRWAIAGDTQPHKLVSSTSSEAALSTYADLRPDGALTLAVINSDSAKAYNATIGLGSFVPGTAADVWTFDAKNYVWKTDAKPYHAEPDTAPTHTLTCGVASSTTLTVAPASMTVIRFAAPGAATAVLPDAAPVKTPDAGSGTSKSYTLIDDMETTTSGPIQLPMAGTGLSPGSWFGVISTGSTSNKLAPDPFAFSALSSPHETMTGVSSAHAAHITCTVADLYGYCQLGLNFASPDAALDVSKYTGIVFWAMSPISNAIKIQFPNDDSLPTGNKCGKTTAATDGCWDSFASYAPLNDKWQRIEVKLSDLRQDGWGRPAAAFDATTVHSINFVVAGPGSATAQSVSVDFWIDDVYFESSSH
jgi:hypothetical protein